MTATTFLSWAEEISVILTSNEGQTFGLPTSGTHNTTKTTDLPWAEEQSVITANNDLGVHQHDQGLRTTERADDNRLSFLNNEPERATRLSQHDRSTKVKKHARLSLQ